ncbi:gamma carbonic anhydrase family protein [Azospirillum sp. ST 5-10]|uniref:gamma carbonic anhydrase family protein n=1 Tax=Azospirillum sp. ST 5-10 TaxID=3445776 RepID=UPI003F4A5924
MLYALDDRAPRLAPGAWAAPNATLVGDVVLEEEASVWWGAVLRAEQERIRIGVGGNVQDNAVLHVDPGYPLTLGAGVTVGHMAMLHGCTVGDGTLVGIGAVILNGARIGRDCLIGARALIAEGKEIPDRSVVLGAPGKIVREVSDADLERLRQPAAVYRERARLYAARLVALPPPG